MDGLYYTSRMKNILLIGCGNMGSALLARWQTLGHTIAVVEPNTIRAANITHVKNLAELPANISPELIVLAIKPQQLDVLLPELAAKFKNKPAYLSIAAGKTLSYFAQHLGSDASIIRAMPNTPAMVGLGITALIANANTSSSTRDTATQLMQAVGEVVWLTDESQMDVVTAISGSGPAYFFSFMACLIEAAVKNGLSPEVAGKLVKQTAVGASALATQSKEGLCDLITNVTSKGGTTEAALGIFNKDEAQSRLINEAVNAAIKRAKELG